MAGGGVEGDEGLAALNGTNLWPRRRWVDTDRGWASRETNGIDTRRRLAVEQLLSRATPAAEKKALREEIEGLDKVLADWDRDVRDQPVFDD